MLINNELKLNKNMPEIEEENEKKNNRWITEKAATPLIDSSKF